MKEAYKAFILKYRRLLIIFANLFLVVLSYYLSFILRFDFNLPVDYFRVFINTLPFLIIIKLSVFYYFGLFRGLWRYVSIYDLKQIIKANVFATIIFILGAIFIYGTNIIPRFIFVNDFILCVAFIGGIRFLTRIIRERYHGQLFENERVNVLIVGAGEAGILLLKEYRHNPALGEVVGFIDDDKAKQNEAIQGVRILGGRSAISKAAKDNNVGEIVLAIPSAKGEVIRELIACCKVPNVKLKIVPGMAKIISGEFKISLREVRPEDLLGRETVTIDECEIEKYLKNKTVLITGAAGSIGSEICRQAALHFYPAKLILIDHNENNLYFLLLELRSKFKNLNIMPVIGDINDIGLLKKVFSEFRPQVVFHAAAYKHVPLMEDNQIAAVKNNSLGSRNMIYAAHHYKVDRFVLISTDKAVNPVNTMGLSKRLAEIFLQAKARRSKTKFMAVRFGNVLGSDGSVVPLFKKQIASGGPITITHPDTTRYFMSIKEAVLLVLQAGAIGVGGEIFILDMGEQIKILDLARDLVSLSGLELGKDIGLEYIGLRPGEKIREELLLDKEKDRVTKHDKIYISQAGELDVVALRKQMKELESYVNATDEEKTVRKMKEIVKKSHVE
ncbi:MAG: nucleoside-diphosphate sugar epimerase/dehydratase [Candidatus Omnitrophica bacterium]|jgi:FlaA1/EpsC-like NDP-sugar epimerase|nr:nucleoside-diphosphate sugar epimerase/dehydratase [Candidatus Omnitrophota bacterium]MDD5660357.1 nucleoside-diphosphate sugar epimerase/dehydratase [Candidatus Omnitrophota bacterium]